VLTFCASNLGGVKEWISMKYFKRVKVLMLIISTVKSRRYVVTIDYDRHDLEIILTHNL
jgi:hypothetical protein